jgi:hypothetical protein
MAEQIGQGVWTMSKHLSKTTTDHETRVRRATSTNW